MAGLSEPIRAAVRVGAALDRQNVPWLVSGALAAGLHGVPRSTDEVELLADLRAEHVPALVADLSAGFFVETRRVMDAIVNRTGFEVVELQSMTRVELFTVRPERLSQQELSRRCYFRIYASNETLPVASAEDTVLRSLDTWRRQQKAGPGWADAVGVLRTCRGTLDKRFLEREARAAKLTDALEKAWTQAGAA